MKRLSVLFIVIGLAYGFIGVANAALWDRGGGLIYDDDLDITWIQDANYAKTSGYDSDGRMIWDNAVAWADSLVYGGFDDWRLPTTPGTTYGYLNEGEIGHLYYDEGVTYSSPGLFSNVSRDYWFGTEYASNPIWAWEFIIYAGVQTYNSKDQDYYAWAVRDGDVAPVPIPASILLLGSGLVGLAGFRRKCATRGRSS